MPKIFHDGPDDLNLMSKAIVLSCMHSCDLYQAIPVYVVFVNVFIQTVYQAVAVNVNSVIQIIWDSRENTNV